MKHELFTRRFILLFLFILILGPSFSSFFTIQTKDTPIIFNNKEKVNDDILSLIPQGSVEGPIYIDGDTDLGNAADNGTGAIGHPYIIENRIIDAGRSNGIHIESTSYSFEIRNCTIFNARNGIELRQIATGTAKIYNNTIFDCRDNNQDFSGVGIHFYQSHQLEIMNNDISNHE